MAKGRVLANDIRIGARSFEIGVVIDFVDNPKELQSNHAKNNEATNNDGLYFVVLRPDLFELHGPIIANFLRLRIFRLRVVCDIKWSYSLHYFSHRLS